MNHKNIISAYELLELNTNASLQEIKQAYRLKAKQFHPDLYFDRQEKKAAEEKFKLIKEAYDYLLANQINNSWNNETNEQFSTFFNQEDFFNDDYDNFYFEQLEETRKFEKLQKKAINIINDEIKKRNINLIDVFNAIKQNKVILKWLPGEVSSSVLYDFLIKEDLYRRYIKNTDEYKGFVLQNNYYSNLNKYATLIINPKLYKKKKFEERIYYIIKNICASCCGMGCNYCNYLGYIEQEHNLNIKISLNKPLKYYEINNGGNHSVIDNGKLILTVKINNKINSPFKIVFQNNQYKKYVPIIDALDNIKLKTQSLLNWISSHKHLSFLYLIIFVLVITIICLIALL